MLAVPQLVTVQSWTDGALLGDNTTTFSLVNRSVVRKLGGAQFAAPVPGRKGARIFRFTAGFTVVSSNAAAVATVLGVKPAAFVVVQACNENPTNQASFEKGLTLAELPLVGDGPMSVTVPENAVLALGIYHDAFTFNSLNTGYLGMLSMTLFLEYGP